jgi:hypothetical protein
MKIADCFSPHPPLRQECLQQRTEALNKTNNHCLKIQRDEKQKGVLHYEVTKQCVLSLAERRSCWCGTKAKWLPFFAVALQPLICHYGLHPLHVPTKQQSDAVSTPDCRWFCECFDYLSDRTRDVPCRDGSPNPQTIAIPTASSWLPHTKHVNLLKPTCYVMHQRFNIQQLYTLPTLYLFVLYLSENKQRLVPLTA